jgi:hypothetical protein
VRLASGLTETTTLIQTLTATRLNDALSFDHELAMQLCDMTKLTHVWKAIREQQSDAEEELEVWRLRRVKAEADTRGMYVDFYISAVSA